MANKCEMSMRDYMAQYRRENPERILKNRLQTAVNLLVKHGYTVILPADQQQTNAAPVNEGR